MMARYVWIIEKEETGDYQERNIVGLYSTLDKCAKAFAEEVNCDLRDVADSNIRWGRHTAENLSGHMSEDRRNPDGVIHDGEHNDWVTAYAIKRITHDIELGHYCSPEKKHLSGMTITIKNVPQVKISAIKSEMQEYNAVHFTTNQNNCDYIVAYKIEVN